MDNLFQFIPEGIKLHSGKVSKFKIDCDAFTDADIKCLAWMINEHFSNMTTASFFRVIGIPRGGIRLAKALEKYEQKDGEGVLIVDDVLTTGRSMNEMREEVEKVYPASEIFGVVIFSRAPSKEGSFWIRPMFELW
jgi:orotate phosphoribosyltransferase